MDAVAKCRARRLHAAAGAQRPDLHAGPLQQAAVRSGARISPASSPRCPAATCWRSAPARRSRSVAELIAYAKANPGKLTYGSAGIGSTLHLAAEFFKRAAGIDILHVPYKGAAQATTDLVGGQVQMMFGPLVAIMPLAAGRQAARAGGDLGRSARRSRRTADDDRKRHRRLRGHRLVRARRAGRHAEGRRSRAQRRDQQRAEVAGADRAVPPARLRAARRHAGRDERADQGRHRALDQDHPATPASKPQ